MEVFNDWQLYLLLGLLIVIALAVYAWRLWRRLKAMEASHRATEQAAQLGFEEQKKQAQNGLRILATALLQDELTLTEASMRIAWSLTQIDEQAHEKQRYSAFFQLAEATAHIPILDQWKALPRKQQYRFTVERARHEENFKPFVLEAARVLLEEFSADRAIEVRQSKEGHRGNTIAVKN